MAVSALTVNDHRTVRQGIRLLQHADPEIKVTGQAVIEAATLVTHLSLLPAGILDGPKPKATVPRH